MRFTKLALTCAALGATCALALPAFAQDNSDVVGTWFGVSDVTAPTQATGPTYVTSIWQFRADGTMAQIDTAFAGVMAVNGKPSMQTGIVSPYYGNWKRMPDGTVRIVALHLESQSSTEPSPGTLKAIVKITDKFDPKTGVLNHCLQMVPIDKGLYDPTKNKLSALPPVETCPGPNPRFNISSKLERLE